MHNRLFLSLFGAVAALATWTTSPAAVAVGRIEGSVVLVSPGGPPLASGAYPSRQVVRRTPPPSELANVVVAIKEAPAGTTAAPITTRIAQRDESFVPRVAAITRGSTVEFPNFDPYFHNVFSLSRGSTFDLGRFPRGESRARTFTQTGLIKVYCHFHSEMSATIVVFDHPYFAVPAADGSFSIAEVPAGSYRLSAWHERIGESLTSIEVKAGAVARIKFVLPLDVQ